jgi:tetratricopeptide (TPR) repeat protein
MFYTEEYDKAIADYKDAIRLGDSYVFHYAIGDCYMKLSDFANAISYYEQSLQRNPNNSEVKKKLETAKEKAKEGGQL